MFLHQRVVVLALLHIAGSRHYPATSELIFNSGPQLSGPSDGDFFLEVLMAIDGQQQIGDQARQDLDHEAVGTACNQVIDLQVPFPPGKEILDIPSQLVRLGDLFTGKLVAVGCNPVLDPVDLVAHQSQRCLALIDALGAQQHGGVEKDNALGRHLEAGKNVQQLFEPSTVDGTPRRPKEAGQAPEGRTKRVPGNAGGVTGHLYAPLT